MKNIKTIILTGFMMTLGCTGIQAAMGNSSKTWAPQVFTPAAQYNDNDGMVGNYFKGNQTATIHNPNLKTENGYTFTDVETGGINAPQGKLLIGRYNSITASNGRITSQAIAMINLYGIEQN